MALKAVRSHDIEGTRQVIHAIDESTLSLADVLDLYQTELETQNQELVAAHARTEQELAWCANLFRRLPMAAVLLDPEGMIRDVNHKAQADLGLSNDALHQALPMRRLMASVQAETRFKAMLKRAEAGQVEGVDEVMLRTLDGVARWSELRMARMPFSETLGSVRYLCIIHDRTDQVEANRALEAAAQAEMQRDMAQTANQAKSQMLARVSHEFRTPLNAVIGFSDLLLAGEQHLQSADARRYVQYIRDAGTNLLTLVDEVLQINKAHQGIAAAALQAMDMAQLVGDAMALIQPIAKQATVALHFDAPVKLGTVNPVAMGHSRAMREVLINLLSNAIKYNRPQGWVRVAISANEHVVTLSVTDNGIGMSAEQLAHLFEPFNRLGAEVHDDQGHGLGLSICRTLVDGMGGKLSVASTAGMGSCFMVSLQAQRVEHPRPPNSRPPNS
jgi:PAS domain S-box-containing protein